LTALGFVVTEIGTDYTAQSLSAYKGVFVYGNMNYDDQPSLVGYVQNGGILIETPWFWINYVDSAPILILTSGNGATYAQSYPGVTVLAPSDPLLTGVNFPSPGGFNIGRVPGSAFESGVTQVVNWIDGTAMIGYAYYGSGKVIAINMHLITSDSSYTAVDQPFVSVLLKNALNA